MDSVFIFLQIVLINVLLSGDNAIVIAMASGQLPPHQRKRAIWWGTLAAVGLRILITLVAIKLLQIPFLQAAGALLLLYIAVKLLADAGNGHEGQAVKKAGTLGQAIWTIVAADFIMSLDNVLAIAAVADGDLILILLGIAISIPMIIWGSQMLGALLQKLPALSYIGAALLGYAAGDMLMHDPGLNSLLFHGSKVLAEAIPLLCVPLVIALATVRRKQW
ncbi:TerC family protein [Paenibacillus harenae]|uniref:YjbE family integral membrane protein n=1 Tax=Paenibacillus harenae TaxID=306543 RepID=A0ABT9U175_PAEHA|nr:TerC family protein [Paenibacillus harenae]MDQ0059375.1 YjbE family integral membrane protein [Paenibacillus harenae]MDQ0112841.1 YjbE family integral membrane protein [Paenibacillus harenae]